MLFNRLFTLMIGALLTLTALTARSTMAQGGDEAEEGSISLNRLLLAREIVDREPQDTSSPYVADGERLYLFVDVRNLTDGEQEVFVEWQNLDTGYTTEQSITVGHSRRWRTWFNQRMTRRRVGRWHVRVRTEDQVVLGELDFEIVPTSPEPGTGEASPSGHPDD